MQTTVGRDMNQFSWFCYVILCYVMERSWYLGYELEKSEGGLQPIVMNPLNASVCLLLDIDVDIDMCDRDVDVECMMVNNCIENNRKYCMFLT